MLDKAKKKQEINYGNIFGAIIWHGVCWICHSFWNIEQIQRNICILMRFMQRWRALLNVHYEIYKRMDIIPWLTSETSAKCVLICRHSSGVEQQKHWIDWEHVSQFGVRFNFIFQSKSRRTFRLRCVLKKVRKNQYTIFVCIIYMLSPWKVPRLICNIVPSKYLFWNVHITICNFIAVEVYKLAGIVNGMCVCMWCCYEKRSLPKLKLDSLKSLHIRRMSHIFCIQCILKKKIHYLSAALCVSVCVRAAESTFIHTRLPINLLRVWAIASDLITHTHTIVALISMLLRKVYAE